MLADGKVTDAVNITRQSSYAISPMWHTPLRLLLLGVSIA